MNKKRIILACVFATFFAVVFPFIKFHELILFSLKIVLAFSTVALAGKFATFKEYFFKVNKFLLLTFLFGGAIYGIFSLIEIDYNFLYGTTNGLIPLGVLLALAFCFTVCVIKLLLSFFKKG